MKSRITAQQYTAVRTRELGRCCTISSVFLTVSVVVKTETSVLVATVAAIHRQAKWLGPHRSPFCE
jgi:hypothetical protein